MVSDLIIGAFIGVGIFLIAIFVILFIMWLIKRYLLQNPLETM